MDRQPVNARRANPALMWLLGATAASMAGCQTDVVVEARFDGPAGAAVLQPDDGGPFSEPAGFVANSRNGRIFGLDLKRALFLIDDPAAPYYPAVPIPTGEARLLGDLVAWGPDASRVTLFVADALTERLLEVPYVIGVTDDGEPIEVTPSAGAVSFLDNDGSGDSAELIRLELHEGYTTTEEWTLTFDGAQWSAEGSRSGLQDLELGFLDVWISDHDEVELIIGGTATAGDQIVFSTETGVVEHDLGGSIQALHPMLDRGWIFASIYDLDTDETALVIFDIEQTVTIGAIALPDGATPWRMAQSADGAELFVADAREAAVYRIALDADDPSGSTVETIAVEAAVADVAWQGDGSYAHLFVALAGENRVDLYDLSDGSRFDINPATPEPDGMVFESPITGLAASTDPVQLLETSETGGRLEERVVAISTFKGMLFIMEGSSGCLAQDELGPYGYTDSSSPFLDQGETSTPSLAESESSGFAVQANTCGGLTQSEEWTATFDETTGDWLVEGERSGVMENRAYENTRYVSDAAEISFTILSGAAPSTAGDQFVFTTVAGISVVEGDLDGNGSIENPLEIPARPVPFSYLAGATGGGWDEVNRKVDVLWPITNDDSVLRVNLQSARAEVIWD